MERNTLTTIYHLKPGDRFYRHGDKNKDVWQKVEHETKTTGFQTYTHWAKKDGQKHPAPMKAATPVVFLRSVTENAT